MADIDAEIHVDDVGTVMRARIVDYDGNAIDVSDAVTKTIRFRKPNGKTMHKTADFTTDGTDSLIQYVTVAGDFDVNGEWQIQGFVSSPTRSNSSRVKSFDVQKNISLDA